MAEWRKQKEQTTREVVGSGDYRFAVVTCVRDGETFNAVFALPPDGEPTGRLWSYLEKQIPNHFIKLSVVSKPEQQFR